MCATPFDGIMEVLELAREKNVRLALVTGKGERSTEITLVIFGIHSYFDVIETWSPLGPRKVQGIKNVLGRLEIAPGETLYIGDAPRDIDASREAGVPVAAVAWAETADPELLRARRPDKLFTSVQELKQYVEQCVQK